MRVSDQDCSQLGSQIAALRKDACAGVASPPETRPPQFPDHLAYRAHPPR